MTNQAVYKIDGRDLYYTFLAGAHRILQHQSELNKMNVFPVNDKDTGTNLASTFRSILDNIKPDRSFTVTAGLIADAALIGARGNSGVIFAQFLYGISLETENKIELTLKEFAEIIIKTVNYIYEAVANPVEGTMLTVIKDWAEYIYSKKEIQTNFKLLFVESLEILKTSLQETKQKLKVLQISNVVDAGAKGFVVFIEGITDLIINRNIRHLVSETSQNITIIHSEENTNDIIDFRYCTEAMIKNLTIKNADIQAILKRYGDSAVVAGSDKAKRIHVHTNNPAELFYELKDHGTITFQKVDDMIRQNDIAKHRKWNIAIVTDSTCDLSQEIIENYQINVLPFNVNFGDNHFLDKITITPDQFYDMLENSDTYPTTSLINEQAFVNLYSHLASHYDAIISIHISGELSGTFKNSQKAAEKISKEFNKPIYVYDSKILSGALGLLVYRTAQAIESGMEMEMLIKSIEDWINKTKIYVSVDTLKYFIKGGRVSKPKGFISNLLNIKPIVSVNKNGKAELIGKAFSLKSNIKKVMKLVTKINSDTKILNYIVLHAQNPEGADTYIKFMTDLTGKAPVSVVNISPAIGINAGIGAAAVSLIIN